MHAHITGTVHHDVNTRTQAENVRTNADVRVDARVARGAGEVFVLSVRYMLVTARVTVLLGEAEVDDVDHVLPLA